MLCFDPLICHILLQCAKEAGQTALRFVSSIILKLVEGGRGAFQSLEKVQPLYKLNKIKKINCNRAGASECSGDRAGSGVQPA